MTKRNTGNQSKHDNKVESVAKRREAEGYSVQADIPGHRKPTSFGGKRPDVIARKGKERIIYEVETPDSVDSRGDREQQKAFKAVADRNPDTRFRKIVTK